MKDALLRSIELLRHLPRAPRRVDAGALEGRLRGLGFDTSRRMIQRDLVALSTHFPIDCQESHKPYGWAWAEGSAPPVVPSLDVPMALLFRLAELHLSELLPPVARAALEPQFAAADRLLRAASGPGGSLADRVRLVPAGFAGRPPQVAPDILAAAMEAVSGPRICLAEYAARGRGQAKAYRLHALGLVLRGGVLLLVAVADTDGGDGGDGGGGGDKARSFLLHRFRHLSVTQTPARTPPGFSLADHIAAGGLAVRIGDAPIDVVLRVEPTAAATVLEGRFGTHQTVTVEADGGAILCFRTPDTQALRAWILGFGPLAEVRGPPALRAWFAETAAALAARYG